MKTAIVTNAVTDTTENEREKRNRQLAYEAAAEGIVLLENDGTLPLEPCSAALFGAGAEYTIKGGSGSGEVNVRHSVNVLEGLEQAGFTITSRDWIRRYDRAWREGKEAFVRAFRKKLFRPGAFLLNEIMSAEYRYPAGDRLTESDRGDADTCIYVVARQSGEGHDRRDEAGDFRLDADEVHNIRFCAEHYRRFILAINTGAPIDLTPLEEITGIGALVYMGQLGMEGGRALADVLTGRQVPSGRLAVSWPRRYADIPFGDEYSIAGGDRAPDKEGIYVGYRYYDSFGVSPRYPFGYGRSYTEFAVKDVHADIAGTEVVCSAAVTNTGTFAGRETVQLYVSCPQNGMPKEYQRLCAFAKTGLLQPGESETLQMTFPVSLLSVYDEQAAETYLEPGGYVLRAGTSSRDTQPVAIMRLAEKTVLSKHRHGLCRPDKPVTVLTENRVSVAGSAKAGTADGSSAGQGQEEQLPELPVLTVPQDAFETKEFSYRHPDTDESSGEHFSEKTERYLDRFGADDMIRFCAGTGLFGKQEGFCVPGAVGHTTAAYIGQGIPNIELCDGPAGLRIQRRSTRTKNGKIKAVDIAISLYEYLPKFIQKFLLGNPEKDPVLYQFVTGFPVAAMVAQSWNTDLACRIGRAVSDEMTEYGARIWLAPALNIVRNPLCGRNFEYYSEDPLVSGKMAAAITRGVQEVSGNCVTIKHFAANSQEENRYYVSSDLDERVLREIYLKGFEIAVREGRPRAIMTAYNRINGVYCANSRELCTDILRSEWGFEGVVMTDWLSTGEDRADESAAIEAGVDLIMPGGKKTLKALAAGCREGRISAGALRCACGRVLDLILAG